MKSSTKSISITILSAIVFCASFVLFYAKHQVGLSSPTAEVEKKNGYALPKAKLVKLNSEILHDDDLRKGKVILVFLSPYCDACQTEGQFLQGLLEKRNDIKFYGIVSFAKSNDVLEAALNRFPFEVLYDSNGFLASSLKITKVPIKIYIQDGIIKKVWGGATITERRKSEFINWFENV